MKNRPSARRKTVTGSGHVSRPSGGSGGGFGGHHGGHGGSSGGHGGGSFGGGNYGGSGHGGGFPTRAAGGMGLGTVVLLVLVFLFSGGNLWDLGGGGDYTDVISSGNGVSSGWHQESNSGKLNTQVSSQAREKFTTIKENGRDKVTLMVFMCGTDLESRAAMGTSDLNEMLKATPSDNVNVLVYTGGCRKWKNNVVSSRCNQIYQVKNGQFQCLVKNAGTGAMTDPQTLTEFIRFCSKNFPANRQDLILWDHGSGSVAGYGYDENYGNGDSMKINEIRQALKDAGTKFDFIGFDACLMATYETALALSDYADYMIASEEVEPGIGWYYTGWLSALAKDPSLPTLEAGKIIADDFTKACNQQCRGQATTLSVVDLAEFSQTLPADMKGFSGAAVRAIESGEYQDVASARSGCREFGKSAGIDQIDLVDFAALIGSGEGKALTKSLLQSVKYNRTSGNMTNAYGLSIYFPYRQLRNVDSMTDTYRKIDMDTDYAKAIKRFAQMQASGQVAGGNQMPSLFGGSGSGGGQAVSGQDMAQLLQTLFSGQLGNYANYGLEGLGRSNTRFLTEDPMSAEEVADYIGENRITAADLKWQKNGDGKSVIQLTEEQWSAVSMVDKALYIEDGSGYIEMGADNLYDFDEDGNLLPDTDIDWLAIDGQPVPYYHMDTVEKGEGKYIVTGRVPVWYNGLAANLLIRFTEASEYGEIIGVDLDYDESVTQTQAKTIRGLAKGDQLKFRARYYNRNGREKDEFQLGKTQKVSDPSAIVVSNVSLPDNKAHILYKFTDMYGKTYWTPEIN